MPVEQSIRALTPDEEAEVEARRNRWRRAIAASFPDPAKELSVAFIVAAATCGYGVYAGNHVLALLGVGMLCGMLMLVPVGRRRRREQMAAVTDPWAGPEEGWRIREIVVRARALVGTVTGDEDYGYWLLFEVGEDAWFFVEGGAFPGDEDTKTEKAAREEVRLAFLHPGGACLDAELSGEPVPYSGFSGNPDDYQDACDAGFVWRPDLAWYEGSEDGRCPKPSFPSTLLDESSDGG